PRGSDPRLRPEPPAVHAGPAGRQGEPADRHERLHDQAARGGPRHGGPATRADLRGDRAGRQPSRLPAPASVRAGRGPRTRRIAPGGPAELNLLLPRPPWARWRDETRVPRPVPDLPARDPGGR